MVIFTIIIFGLATVRTFVPLMKQEAYDSFSTFIALTLVAVTMLWCYVWFLSQYININMK